MMTGMDELVSIVVPVYNVRDYLEKCVDSVLKQTYRKIEVIIVDDGSTDGSGLICEQLTANDNRVKVYHKNNGGLSDARNFGIERSCGDWICFIDSDDFIAYNYIEKLLTVAIEQNSDIAICDPVHVFGMQNAVFSTQNHIKNFNSEEAILEMWYQRSFLFSAWAKIFRRNLFDEIRFTKGIIYEDVDIMHEIFALSSRITYFDAKLYAYVHREGSITFQKFSHKELDILKICKKLNEFSCNCSNKIQKAALAYSVVGNMRIFISAPRTEENAAIISDVEQYIKANGVKVLLDKNIRAKDRAGIILFYVSKKALRYIHSKINRWR